MFFNIMYLRSEQHLPFNVYTNHVFLNRYWEMVQKLFILKLEPDLDPKPEKLCEHAAR